MTKLPRVACSEFSTAFLYGGKSVRRHAAVPDLLFATPESQWEWAKRHRRWFVTPWRDSIGGVVLGIITGLCALALGSLEWRRELLVGMGAGVIGGFVLPFAETLIWWIRQPCVSATEDNVKLRAEIDVLRDELATAKANTSKAADQNKLRGDLGQFMIAGQELFRNCYAITDKDELERVVRAWAQTTSSYLESTLGRSCAAQFNESTTATRYNVPADVSPEKQKLCFNVRFRLANLNRIMDRI